MTLPECVAFDERQDYTEHGEKIQNEDFFWNYFWGCILHSILFYAQVVNCYVDCGND